MKDPGEHGPQPFHFVNKETGPAREKDKAKVTQGPRTGTHTSATWCRTTKCTAWRWWQQGRLTASPCLQVTAPVATEALMAAGSWYGPGRMHRSSVRETRATFYSATEAGEAKGKREAAGEDPGQPALAPNPDTGQPQASTAGEGFLGLRSVQPWDMSHSLIPRNRAAQVSHHRNRTNSRDPPPADGVEPKRLSKIISLLSAKAAEHHLSAT